MQPYISMITLGVDDMASSVRFYRDGLMWPQLDSPPEVAFFSLHGTWLGLYGRQALADEAGVSAAGVAQGVAVVLSHNVPSTDAVDAVMARAEQAGAVITSAARTMHWGGYCGHFQDPNGHVWEVAYNPFLAVGFELTDANAG
jgi:uncharacterized protein